MGRPSYAVVTAARDEEVNLGRLAESLANQTQLPVEWLIVDNGSTDGTASTIATLMSRHPWISAVRTAGASVPSRGTTIASALEAGFAAVKKPSEAVVVCDADVSFGPSYFLRLMAAFDDDPRVGIVSGTRLEFSRGRWRPRHVTGSHVQPQCRAYRIDCLHDVLPYEKTAGWDGIDVAKANVKGWRTFVLPNLVFRHHRRLGRRDGSRWRAWANEGQAAYSMGYRPTYVAFRAAFHALDDPAALGLLEGYVGAVLRRDVQCHDADVLAYLRHQQSLRRLASRFAEARGRPRAKHRPN
jgi:biofilm PGA synthesis N-glycosyltransferase PgaC